MFAFPCGVRSDFEFVGSSDGVVSKACWYWVQRKLQRVLVSFCLGGGLLPVVFAAFAFVVRDFCFVLWIVFSFWREGFFQTLFDCWIFLCSFVYVSFDCFFMFVWAYAFHHAFRVVA